MLRYWKEVALGQASGRIMFQFPESTLTQWLDASERLQLRTLTDLSLTECSDGSGTITFGPTQFMDSFFPVGSWPGRRRYAPPAFDLIERAKEVYEIICKAQRARSANA